MSHIESKSINIWLRYDPKCNPASLQMVRLHFWVISQPNVDGFCFNMAHSVACALRLTRTDTRTDTFDIRMRRGTNEVNSNVPILVIRWMLYTVLAKVSICVVCLHSPPRRPPQVHNAESLWHPQLAFLLRPAVSTFPVIIVMGWQLMRNGDGSPPSLISPIPLSCYIQ